MEAATATPTQQAAPPPRLREKYENEILPAMTEKFGYSTPMEAPKLLKITLNMGLGKEKQDARSFELAHEQLAIIAGQHPNVRRARKSIAAFKLREGMPFAQSGRPGQAEREAAEKAAEEEREHEEARLKAETEQAAREELKEENPEAYARPEGDDTADESAADGGDTAAEES
jgi:hypothetical protein